MRSPVIILFIASLLVSLSASSQHENKKWKFGNWTGLDFMTNPPGQLTNTTIVIPAGCGTVSDAMGNLLFFTDGQNVWNKNDVFMANGTGLMGGFYSTQSGLIVKQPGNTNIYYVFTTPVNAGPQGLRYSTVDMSLAAGLGSVTVKNVLLKDSTCEKLTPIKHCNGVDIWVLSHDWNTNRFRANLVTASGVNSVAVLSSAGPAASVTSGNNWQAQGQMKASPNGRKIGLATYFNTSPGRYELYDFDPATGIVSNPLVLLNVKFPYGCEFSPDGSKFYGARYNGETNPVKVYQWDVCAGSPQAIVASQQTFAPQHNQDLGHMQLAPDGKIYIATCGSHTLGVISNPNGYGTAANVQLSGGFFLSPGSSAFGFPNFIQQGMQIPYTFTSNCNSLNFTAPAGGSSTLASACSPSGYSANSVLWNFGDPASGAQNTSTLFTPVHVYSSTGTFTTQLIMYRNCSTDTIRLTHSITAMAPILSLSGNQNVCKGQKTILTATGAATYSWSNGAATTSASIQPPSTGTYVVTGTTGTCSAQKIVTVTVSECTELIDNNSSATLKFYPNPFSGLLHIESHFEGTLFVTDVQGRIVLTQTLTAGIQEIEFEIQPGMYFLSLGNSPAFPKQKVIKE